MTMSYHACETMYAKRRKSNNFKRVSHNQRLYYDKERDCYQHKHHSTITVEIYRDHYRVFTGGWDTVTTWMKIHEFAPIHVTSHITPSAIGNKFVVWNGWGRDMKFTEFYDGIKINADGVPLEPQPVQFRRMKKGVCAEFNELARDVRQHLMPRIMLGEFEELDGDVLDGDDLFKLMREVKATSGGLFPEYMSMEKLTPLFVRRPQQCFGKTKTYMWEADTSYQPAIMNLTANIAAAKRMWISKYLTSDQYMTITKDCS